MKRNTWIGRGFVAVVAAIGSLAMTGGEARAQATDDFGFKAGEFDLTLTGSGSNDRDFNNGGFNVNAQLGYFVVDQLSLNVRQGAGYSDFGGGSSWTGATRVGIDYFFDLDRFQPFVGASIGYLYGDGITDTFAAGPEAGLRFFVNDTTFIFASIAYEFFFENADDADSSFDDGQFIYSLGIGFKW